jgi:hypothetical protein
MCRDWEVREDNTHWLHPYVKFTKERSNIVKELLSHFPPQQASASSQYDKLLQLILQINGATFSPLREILLQEMF